jgi:2-polyprenyl-6-methoxyphenol hydroxylase-like FAD-dependent oxidoreductase
MSPRAIDIVGGGLAGLSLGTALVRAGVPVIVYEAGDYPRHRVCGEFIAGLGQKEISALQLDAVLEGAANHRSVAWFHQDRQAGRQTLASPALGISRLAMDKRLADVFVAAGGDLRTRSRVESRTSSAGRVWTSGRVVRVSNWVGLKMHVRGITLSGDLEVHLGRSAYVGVCNVEGGWTNVCGLFPRERVRREEGDNLLRDALHRVGLSALARRLESGEVRKGSEMVTAGLCYDDDSAADGRFRVGDAMTTLPPFTGHGMALAFQAAAEALPFLRAWAFGDCSWIRAVEEGTSAMQAMARRRLGLARAIHPWLFQPFRQRVFAMASRAQILPVTLLTRMLHS